MLYLRIKLKSWGKTLDQFDLLFNNESGWGIDFVVPSYW